MSVCDEALPSGDQVQALGAQRLGFCKLCGTAQKPDILAASRHESVYRHTLKAGYELGPEVLETLKACLRNAKNQVAA